MSNLEAVKRYQKRHPSRLAKLRKRLYKRQKAKGWPNRKQWLTNHPEAKVCASARTTAWSKGLDFTLKKEDIQIPDTCPILGIPLFHTPGRRTANTPSIDRKDCTKGYTPDNVVIISWRANDLKGNMTLDELRRLAAFYLD